MNSFLVYSLLVSVAIATVSCSAIAPAAEEPGVGGKVITDVEINDENSQYNESDAVTPYGYEATLMQASGQPLSCKRCNSPCSSYMCCTGTHPKCCLKNGRCMCCK